MFGDNPIDISRKDKTTHGKFINRLSKLKLQPPIINFKLKYFIPKKTIFGFFLAKYFIKEKQI